MKRLAQNVFKGLLAAVVLFVTVAMARAVVGVGSGVAQSALPSLLGLLGAVGVFCLGFRGRRFYIFGHELTHWLAAKAFRRQTSSFRVGLRGGSVAVERPNLFIVLCPYFVPLYSLVWVGLYGVYLALFAGPPSGGASFAFQVGLGASYGFHLAFTIWTLWAGQKDLLIFGTWFSLSVILFGNTLVLLLTTLVATREWGAGMGLFGGHLQSQWATLARGVSALWALGLEAYRRRPGTG
ncbi:MAG: hypothetical protein HN849_18140 [Victivallales bacterium]|nr:hypothetical protein [Victivallales bacterium]